MLWSLGAVALVALLASALLLPEPVPFQFLKGAKLLEVEIYTLPGASDDLMLAVYVVPKTREAVLEEARKELFAEGWRADTSSNFFAPGLSGEIVSVPDQSQVVSVDPTIVKPGHTVVATVHTPNWLDRLRVRIRHPDRGGTVVAVP